jgi:hypothetical protein
MENSFLLPGSPVAQVYRWIPLWEHTATEGSCPARLTGGYKGLVLLSQFKTTLNGHRLYSYLWNQAHHSPTSKSFPVLLLPHTSTVPGSIPDKLTYRSPYQPFPREPDLRERCQKSYQHCSTCLDCLRRKYK